MRVMVGWWCLGCVWLCWGCERKSREEIPKPPSVSGRTALCEREGILGSEPVVGGRCTKEADCGAERAAWRRCVAGRCVVAGGTQEDGHQAAVRAAVFLSERAIASADESGMIWLWRRDGVRWRPWHGWKGHTGAILALERGAAGYLLSGGVGGVRVWDLRRRVLVADWPVQGEVQALAWSEKHQRIAISSTDRVVRWRAWPKGGVFGGDKKASGRDEKASGRDETASGRDETASGGWSGEVGVCDVVRSLAWEVDGSGRLAGGGDDGLLWIWDVKRAKQRGSWLVERWSGHRGWLRRVGWWGERPVTVGFDGTIRVWDLRRGRSVRVGEEGPSLPLLLGRVERCVASMEQKKSVEAVVWKRRWIGGDPLGMALFSRRGWGVVGAHREGWLRWPDAEGSEVVVWSLREAKQHCRVREHLLGVRVVAGSPKERRFVSGSDDGTLRVFRLGL